MSKGEEKISHLLREKGISFEREKTFEDLRGGKYRFDFFLPYKNVVVEINGNQHYEMISRFHKNKTEFYKAQERDRRKISYCLANKILIYCIPYWEIDGIKAVEDIFQNKFLARSKWKNDEDWKRHQH